MSESVRRVSQGSLGLGLGLGLGFWKYQTTLAHKVDCSPNPVPYYIGGGGTSFMMGSASNHDHPNRIPWIQTGVGFPILLMWGEGAEERRR